MTARSRKQPPIAVEPVELEPLLTTNEVARIVRRSPDTVRLWRYEGRGPAFVLDEISGGVWYEPAALREWIAAQRVVPGSL